METHHGLHWQSIHIRQIRLIKTVFLKQHTLITVVVGVTVKARNVFSGVSVLERPDSLFLVKERTLISPQPWEQSFSQKTVESLCF